MVGGRALLYELRLHSLVRPVRSPTGLVCTIEVDPRGPVCIRDVGPDGTRRYVQDKSYSFASRSLQWTTPGTGRRGPGTRYFWETQPTRVVIHTEEVDEPTDACVTAVFRRGGEELCRMTTHFRVIP